MSVRSVGLFVNFMNNSTVMAGKSAIFLMFKVSHVTSQSQWMMETHWMAIWKARFQCVLIRKVVVQVQDAKGSNIFGCCLNSLGYIQTLPNITKQMIYDISDKVYNRFLFIAQKTSTIWFKTCITPDLLSILFHKPTPYFCVIQ